MNTNARAATASAFSVQDCDAYLDHLAELNTQGKLVIASDDVHNEFGVLLLQRGSPLGIFAAEKMRGHRLNRPLDDVLDFRRRLTLETLLVELRELVEIEPDLAEIHARLGFDDPLRHLCNTLDLPAPLLQKLSALQHALPRVFHRALFSAWFGALVARERNLPADEVALLFKAGLVHDLGLLHIDPQLVDKRSGIGPGEWHAIQQHVAIGSRIVATHAAGAPRLAVLLQQHHERGDGAGYPQGLALDDTDPLAGVLALTDIVHAMRFPSLLLGKQTLADCMPWMRVNRRSTGDDNYHAVGRIVLGARSGKPRPAGTAPLPPTQGLIDANRSLITLLQMFASVRAGIAQAPDQKLARSVLTLLDQVQWVASASGIGNPVLGGWLEQILEANDAAASLAEIFATTRELFWLVRRIDRLLEELLANGHGGESGHDIISLSTLVKSELKRSWRLFATSATTPG